LFNKPYLGGAACWDQCYWAWRRRRILYPTWLPVVQAEFATALLLRAYWKGQKLD
jgi:hypothetical protein